jgi:hypothetical protein
MPHRKSVDTAKPRPEGRTARRKGEPRQGSPAPAAPQAAPSPPLAPENIEAVARSITERMLTRFAGQGEHLRALVEAHWPTTARELRAGLIDAHGNILTSRFVAERRTAEGSEASGRSAGHAARAARAARSARKTQRDAQPDR